MCSPKRFYGYHNDLVRRYVALVSQLVHDMFQNYTIAIFQTPMLLVIGQSSLNVIIQRVSMFMFSIISNYFKPGKSNCPEKRDLRVLAGELQMLTLPNKFRKIAASEYIPIEIVFRLFPPIASVIPFD